MIKSQFNGNCSNKSDIIRQVFSKYPLASNTEIRKRVNDIYKVDVESNLICAAIGPYKKRKQLTPRFQSLLSESRAFLKKFDDCIEQAFYFLRQVSR